MINCKWLLFLLPTCLYGCSENISISDENINDLNSDGIEDIAFEYDSEGYYQLLDRNFDGKVDESSRYTLDNYLVSSRSDDDFDGFLETKIICKHGIVFSVLVDTDNNNFFDVVFQYSDGVIKSAEKYYKENHASKAKIGKVIFSFGYPVGSEKAESVKLTEEEFSFSKKE